jgi:hypothetical protein
MPGIVERANMQKPHAEYAYTPTVSAHAPAVGRIDIYPHRHLPFAASLTIPKKFSRFQAVKKERQGKRFPKKMSLQTPPAAPVTGLLRNAVCIGKFNKLFSIAKRKLKNIGNLFPKFPEINYLICPYKTEIAQIKCCKSALNRICFYL